MNNAVLAFNNLSRRAGKHGVRKSISAKPSRSAPKMDKTEKVKACSNNKSQPEAGRLYKDEKQNTSANR